MRHCAVVFVSVALLLCSPVAGANPAAFEEAARAAASLPRLRSLLVSHRGTLVLERYFNGARAARPANVKSVAKSVISALVGIAVDRGLF